MTRAGCTGRFHDIRAVRARAASEGCKLRMLESDWDSVAVLFQLFDKPPQEVPWPYQLLQQVSVARPVYQKEDMIGHRHMCLADRRTTVIGTSSDRLSAQQRVKESSATLSPTSVVVFVVAVWLGPRIFGMAQLRVDDPSPFIHYDATFRMATPYGDPRGCTTATGEHIMQLVLRAAQLLSDSMAQAYRYTVTLDGKEATGEGYSKSSVFGFLLFASQNLDNGQHVVKLVNTPSQLKNGSYWVDLDYVVISSNVASKSLNIPHSEFQYDSNSWTTDNRIVGVADGIALHAVQQKGSSAAIYFTGSGIDLYGVVCPSCGTFSINMDGIPQHSKPFNASTGSSEWIKTNQVFFSARNLEDSTHVLRVTALDDKPLAIQEAIVYSEHTSAESAASENESSSSKGMSTAVIWLEFSLVCVEGSSGNASATVTSEQSGSTSRLSPSASLILSTPSHRLILGQQRVRLRHLLVDRTRPVSHQSGISPIAHVQGEATAAHERRLRNSTTQTTASNGDDGI
ncbi:hypothetical protein BKA62DRAFT_771859 [Auriculariales sp. MPI-PUGE-AT-0066]|nr:hypothetical protein BKA62DRAFT_771859 [Auriculariales sp. MPI-PUGE-AT-0066]